MTVSTARDDFSPATARRATAPPGRKSTGTRFPLAATDSRRYSVTAISPYASTSPLRHTSLKASPGAIQHTADSGRTACR